MKTKRFRLLTVLLAAVMLVALSLNVMAAKSNAVTQEGLTAQLFTDKDSYKAGESVKASVQVDNHTGREVFIFTQINVPNGVNLASESAAFDARIQDGESWITPGGVSLSAGGVATADAAATGDNMQAGFYIILTVLAVCGIFALFVYGKNHKTWLSMLLCMVMVGGLAAAAVPVQAADISNDIQLSCTVEVDGKDTEISANVSYVIYDNEEAEETVTEVTEPSTETSEESGETSEESSEASEESGEASEESSEASEESSDTSEESTEPSDSITVNEIIVEYNAEDATENIRAALAAACLTPGRDRIVLSNQGDENTKWISEPLYLGDNVEFYLEAGVTLQAKSGEAFELNKQAFVVVEDKTNVSIIGEDSETSVIRMNIEEYTEGEWRHCISICGGTNVIVRNLTVAESGGDGIVLGASYYMKSTHTLHHTKNVVIENVISDSNARQGISIIDGEKITINNCKLINTGYKNVGTAAKSGPFAGIDIEPEPHCNVTDITITNCEFDNNRRYGILIQMSKQTAEKQNADEDVVFDISNCIFSNSNIPIALKTRREGVRGIVNISNSVIDSATGYYHIYMTDWCYNEAEPVTFKDVISVNAACGSENAVAFISDEASNGYANGGLVFDNFYVFDSTTANILGLQKGTAAYPTKGVNGVIYTDQAEPQILNKSEAYSDINLSFEQAQKTKETVFAEIEANKASYDEKTAVRIAKQEAEMLESYRANVDAVDEIFVFAVTNRVAFEGQKPVITEDGIIMLPMDAIFETYEATVQRLQDTVIINKEGVVQMTMVVGNQSAIINGEVVTLETAPQLMNDEVMVPLSLVIKALGVTCEWQEDLRRVNLGRSLIPQVKEDDEIIITNVMRGYREYGTVWATSSSHFIYDGTPVRSNTYMQLTGPYAPYVTYTPEITEEGYYDVYVYKVQRSNADSTTGFEIVYDTNTALDPEPAVQNWQEGESEWVKLNEEPLYFTAQSYEDGTQYVKVKKTALKAKNYIIGTAAKFVKVENVDVETEEATEAWFQLDLGAAKTFNEIQLESVTMADAARSWFIDFALQYNAGTAESPNWVTVKEETGYTSNNVSVSLDEAVTAQQVRFLVTKGSAEEAGVNTVNYFNVYNTSVGEDGQKVLGTNLAAGATATVSTGEITAPASTTQWVSSKKGTAEDKNSVTLTFAEEKTINKIDLYFRYDNGMWYPLWNYTISYLKGAEWVPIVDVTENGTERLSDSHTLDEAVKTTQIRIESFNNYAIKADGTNNGTVTYSRLNEIEVYDENGVNVAFGSNIEVDSTLKNAYGKALAIDGWRNPTDGIGWQLTAIPVGQTDESNSNE